ncbi:MAG: 16S rRNA (cytosine(1402)-N(4))-methyltransferase RsmH [Actinomycetota bacterium]
MTALVTFSHRPVLLDEVTELLASVPEGIVVDGTLGGGGHSAALLEARPDLTVVGVDRDPAARVAAAERLAAYGDRISIVDDTSDRGIRRAAERGAVTGVLLDLGVSSPQIDEPGRGFSYRNDGPLDMRMDPTIGPTAAELLDGIDERDLARLLRDLSDEPHARRIARAIVAARPLRTTGELAEVVRNAVPAAARRRGDPSKRTFQALRIAVNDELDLLERSLDAALEVLAPGGRLVVLAYHSGEDRLVKDRFRAATDPTLGLPRHLPIPPDLNVSMRLLTRKAVTATPAEADANPRATSARLRAVERLHEEP